MSAPKRIQRKRARGWRMPEGAVYVGRPTKWGNPFVVGQTKWMLGHTDDVVVQFHPRDAAEAVAMFRHLMEASPAIVDQIRAELAGRDLACWCPLEDEHGKRVPCHADVLLEIANAPR